MDVIYPILLQNICSFFFTVLIELTILTPLFCVVKLPHNEHFFTGHSEEGIHVLTEMNECVPYGRMPESPYMCVTRHAQTLSYFSSSHRVPRCIMAKYSPASNLLLISALISVAPAGLMHMPGAQSRPTPFLPHTMWSMHHMLPAQPVLSTDRLHPPSDPQATMTCYRCASWTADSSSVSRPMIYLASPLLLTYQNFRWLSHVILSLFKL